MISRNKVLRQKGEKMKLNSRTKFGVVVAASALLLSACGGGVCRDRDRGVGRAGL